jgi:hypothetical protein
MQPAEKPSLYDRLGGVYSIATVVNDLIYRPATLRGIFHVSCPESPV